MNSINIIMQEITNDTEEKDNQELYANEDDNATVINDNQFEDIIELNIYKCKECTNEYEDLETLKAHLWEEHAPYQCEKCDKRFSQVSRLNIHIRSAHLESMKIPCEICNRIFRTKYNLQQHLFTHSKEPHYTCENEKCGKKFRHLNSLRQHEKVHKIHSKNRQECPICHEHVTRLKNHILKHEEKKPFSCDQCSKSFCNGKQLTEHNLLHLGILHSCEVCSTAFTTAASLYKHHTTIHNNVTFICPVCSKEFNRKDNMMSHVRRVHNMEINTKNTLRRKGIIEDSDFLNICIDDEK